MTTRIETRSIDYVPEAERHGKVWQQGPFWFLGNFQPFTVAIGLIGPSLGLSFWWTALACVLGVAFGTLFMAFHASQGPVLGLPQMVQSRAQMGYRGVLLPLVATLFTFVGFNVVDTRLISTGLSGVFGWDPVAVGIAITVVAALLACYGHDWLHRAFQALFVVSVPFWVILTVGILAGTAVPDGAAPAAATGGFTLVGFLVQFTASASYNITYAPYVSDYSRYLPGDTPMPRIVGAVFWGATGSPFWLMPIGAWLATQLGATDPLAGLNDAGNAVFPGLGGLLTVLAVLALVATMGINAYSAMLTVLTGLDSLRPIRHTAGARVITVLVVSVIGAVLGIWLVRDATTALSDGLLIMLYLLTPWTAVNLVDFYFVRRGHYAITDLFRPDGIYGRWAWRGILAFAVGIVVEVPFAVLSFFTGPAAAAMHQVDLAFLVGLVVAGVLYYRLTRSLDLSAERPAIRRSEEALAR
ncbi:cytosine permease [Pseudonocardia eucalypti]|uniref:Cytosine permease n=1 Tax=Pseudonocardia eucalypti TaxID=648755 RepID=A0ABP9QEC3_9PSEU|nr:purine-cytosine permease-like protein [Pseudonocardia eucalypti]